MAAPGKDDASRRPARLAAAMLAAALAASPASARPTADALRGLQAQDLRVATIGYRLATAALPFCESGAYQAGIAFHDLSQYGAGAQDAAREAFGLGEAPAVLAVVPGSPAERAGVRAGDEVVAIDDVPVPAAEGARSFQRMAALGEAVERSGSDGEVRLTLRRDGAPVAATMILTPGCPSRFQLRPSTSLNAEADGTYVQVTTRMVEYTGDEETLAGMMAHELAHNILDHRVRLNAAGMSRGLFRGFGRNGRLSRAAEEEADRLAPYLLELAGYPTRPLVTFWTRYRRDHGLGIFRDGTHPGEKARIDLTEREIARIERLKAAGQPIRPDLSAGTAALEAAR